MRPLRRPAFSGRPQAPAATAPCPRPQRGCGQHHTQSMAYCNPQSGQGCTLSRRCARSVSREKSAARYDWRLPD